MTNFKNHALKRMHIRTSMKSSINYSLRPSVTLKIQTRHKFLEKYVTLIGDSLEIIATSHNLDMREVLKHPLSLLPWALSNCDSTLKNTSNKSTLARHIESRVAPAKSIPMPSTCIIDGMSLVNKIGGDNWTYEDIVESIS